MKAKQKFHSQLLRTPRNILIANIAVSDILLCVFTMPLSLLDMIHNYWPLGSGQVCQNDSQSLFKKELLAPPKLISTLLHLFLLHS